MRRTIRWLLASTSSIRHIVFHVKVIIISVVHNNFHTLAPYKVTIVKRQEGHTQALFYFADDATLCFAISKRKKKLPTKERLWPTLRLFATIPSSTLLRSVCGVMAKKLPCKGTVTMYLGKINT